MADLSALIEELQRATEPSRELDEAIVRATWRGRVTRLFRLSPEYTSSLDAALTLVPGGLCWRYDSALGHAVLFDLSRSPVEVAESGDAELTTYPPALALVIASLRARQAGEGK